MRRAWAAIRAEYRLLRVDFWASRHSGALLILAFGLPMLVVLILL